MKNARKHAAAVRRLTDSVPAPHKGRPAADAAPGRYIVKGTPFDAGDAAAVYAVAVRAAAAKNKWMYQRYARPENLLNWYAAAAIRERMNAAADMDAARAELDAARAAAIAAGDMDAARAAGEKAIAAYAAAAHAARAAALDADRDAAARYADAAARLEKNPADAAARADRDAARADRDAAAVQIAAIDAAPRLEKTIHQYQTRKGRADYYTASGQKIKVETGETTLTDFDADALTGETMPAVFEHIHAAALYIIGRRPRTVAGAYVAANSGIGKYARQYAKHNGGGDYDSAARKAARAIERAAHAARADRAARLWGLDAAAADEYATRPGYIGNHDKKGGTPRRPGEFVSLDTLTAAAVRDAARRADAAAAAADNPAADMPAPGVIFENPAAPAAVETDAPAILAFLDAARITAGQYAAARAVVMLSGAIPGGRGDAVRPVDIATAWIDRPQDAPDYARDLMTKYAGDADAARARIARRVAGDLKKLAGVKGLRDVLTAAGNTDRHARKGRPAPAPALTAAAVRDAIARIDAGETLNAPAVKTAAARPVIMPAPRAAAPAVDYAAAARRADADARRAAHAAADMPADMDARAAAVRAGIAASRATYAAAPGVKWTAPRPVWAYVNDAPGVDARIVRDAAAVARDDARRAAAAARRARRVETAADVRAARFAAWLTDIKGMEKNAAARFAARAVARGEIV